MGLLKLLGLENNDKSMSERMDTYRKEKTAFAKEQKKIMKEDGYWKTSIGSKEKGIWTPFKK